MTPWISGLDGPYMWSDLTEYSGFSGQLRIITSRKYVLKFDVIGQYICYCNF